MNSIVTRHKLSSVGRRDIMTMRSLLFTCFTSNTAPPVHNTGQTLYVEIQGASKVSQYTSADRTRYVADVCQLRTSKYASDVTRLLGVV